MRLGVDLPEVASETLATRSRTPALPLDRRDELPALAAGIVVMSCAVESAESDDENRRPDFSFPCAKVVVLSLTAVFLLSTGRRQLVERGIVDFLLAPVAAAAAGLNLAIVVT